MVEIAQAAEYLAMCSFPTCLLFPSFIELAEDRIESSGPQHSILQGRPLPTLRDLFFFSPGSIPHTAHTVLPHFLL